MATSALDMFTPRYAGQLSPKAKHILAGLPANVVQLASFDAHKAADDKISKLCESPADDESLSGPIAYWNRVRAQARKQLARDVPALNALSDKDLDVVIMVARSAMIAGKHGLVPTDTAVLTRTYAMGVDALAWAFLYHKLGKIPPTTPLREMFPADELGLAGADPATPVGDVLPHDALVQGCRDACAGAAELLDVLEMESYERFIPAAEIGFLNLPRNSEAENVAARYLEILCGLISTRTSISGSAPRRSWNREDFRLDTRSVKEVSKFLKTPFFKYDDLTLRDNWNLNLIRQEYILWCRRAERKPR